jgi:hypothetical protein
VSIHISGIPAPRCVQRSIFGTFGHTPTILHLRPKLLANKARNRPCSISHARNSRLGRNSLKLSCSTAALSGRAFRSEKLANRVVTDAGFVKFIRASPFWLAGTELSRDHISGRLVFRLYVTRRGDHHIDSDGKEWHVRNSQHISVGILPRVIAGCPIRCED